MIKTNYETTITLPEQPDFGENYKIFSKEGDIEIEHKKQFGWKWIVNKKSEHLTECKCVRTWLGKFIDWIK